MKIEIVTHCWNYSRLLTYQLSSLILHPARNVDVQATVFYTGDDERTRLVLDFFVNVNKPENVIVRPWELPRRSLMCRAIGRNLAARASDADVLWFADADHCFGDHCLDVTIEKVMDHGGPLCFPRYVNVHKSHELGDRAVAQLNDDIRLIDINPDEFKAMRYRIAIGGVQIAAGDAVRKIGYCPGSVRRANWSDHWLRELEDRKFRVSMKTGGVGLALPNVYRIRHSRVGRFDRNVSL